MVEGWGLKPRWGPLHYKYHKQHLVLKDVLKDVLKVLKRMGVGANSKFYVCLLNLISIYKIYNFSISI